MIPKKNLLEIKEHLDKSENPLIFFDSDPDGLCSYLLFKRYLGRGKGIPCERSKDLIFYLNKVKEFSPDRIFVLDIFDVSQEFIDSVNVPIIWIDHHPVIKRKGIKHFNPRNFSKTDIKPTSYICYKTVNQDMWISMVGCVADWFIPEFAKEFVKQYPGIYDEKIKDPAKAFHSKGLGELIKIFVFILKTTYADVIKNISILSKVESPYEILNQETPRGKYIYKTALKNGRYYDVLLKEALTIRPEGKLYLFIYPKGNVSYRSHLSNRILYKYKNKFIIIGTEDDKWVKMSMRSAKFKVLPTLKKALKDVSGYGGGHTYACGSAVAKEDFPKFIASIKRELNRK